MAHSNERISELEAHLAEARLARKDDAKIHRDELDSMIRRCRRAEQAIADHRGIHLADLHAEMRAQGEEAAPRISGSLHTTNNEHALQVVADELRTALGCSGPLYLSESSRIGDLVSNITARLAAQLATLKPSCPYGNMPREAVVSHWREWHRGHGCHLDPTEVRRVMADLTEAVDIRETVRNVVLHFRSDDHELADKVAAVCVRQLVITPVSTIAVDLAAERLTNATPTISDAARAVIGEFRKTIRRIAMSCVDRRPYVPLIAALDRLLISLVETDHRLTDQPAQPDTSESRTPNA